MHKHARKWAFAGSSIVAFCAAVGVSAALCASAPQALAADGAQEPTKEEITAVAQSDPSSVTEDEWGVLYPLEYGSYHQSTVKADGQPHGHYDLKAKLLAPVVRDGTTLITDDSGNYAISGFEYDEASHQWVIAEDQLGAVAAQEFKQGCFSCKTSNFDIVYEEKGPGIFVAELDQDFVDTVDGQVWDCKTCHDGDPSSSAPDAQLTYWSQLARDAYDDFDAAERACGQCHNSLDYRSHITDQETMDGFAPYQFGTDIDALYDAVVEDGICGVDEETGALVSTLSHPDVEFTQGSAMRELGVTCVSCHMPQATDEQTGATYTSHNASGSPLESEDSLNYCLSCHSAQGIETTADMKAMVKERQAEAAEIEKAADEKRTEVHELLAQANQSGAVDEATLQEARDKYSRADAYLQAVMGSADYGVKVAHNPMATDNYTAQASALLDEVKELLA
ncbi:MAG: ammonia-forming cytochrome c nitrite reductase subunit c552 [Coriobacteriia bacterium]|nr:ammonia-forming cytochrome c nitrite reductase subunit c552 [Coriobacteriia bacterium]